jgi:shikimate dehydrogenase
VLTGVAGWPVAHSRSPAMHNAAFRAVGLDDWLYVKLPLAPERFAEAVRALPASGFAGINVTIPHKQAALAVADSAAPAAAAIGAANTLTFAEGAIEADNTDAHGFLDAIAQSPAGRTALVLGAGGAARAVVWALREAGAASVAVWNRTPERAAALAAELGADHARVPRPAEILVNATSAGLGGAASELPLTEVGDPALVVDLVYGDAPPPVSAWAAARGIALVDGLEVLVRQGALGFSRWTGKDAPVQDMREAVRTAGMPPAIGLPFG